MISWALRITPLSTAWASTLDSPAIFVRVRPSPMRLNTAKRTTKLTQSSTPARGMNTLRFQINGRTLEKTYSKQDTSYPVVFGDSTLFHKPVAPYHPCTLLLILLLACFTNGAWAQSRLGTHRAGATAAGLYLAGLLLHQRTPSQDGRTPGDRHRPGRRIPPRTWVFGWNSSRPLWALHGRSGTGSLRHRHVRHRHHPRPGATGRLQRALPGQSHVWRHHRNPSGAASMEGYRSTGGCGLRPRRAPTWRATCAST